MKTGGGRVEGWVLYPTFCFLLPGVSDRLYFKGAVQGQERVC